MARILIDGRFIGVGESISRYTLEILKGILKLDKESQFTLLMRPQGVRSFADFFEISKSDLHSVGDILRIKSKFEHLNVKILDIPHYSWAEQTTLLHYLKKEKFDLVHFTQFNHPIYYSGNFVITIHDLTMIGHLHRQNLLKRFAFGAAIKSAALDSKKIITISKFSKKEIIDYYHVPEEKIAITYLAVDSDRFNAKMTSEDEQIKRIKNKYGIDNDYILYTGMWKKHKNLGRLLKAFEIYKLENKDSKGVQLVLAGKIDKGEPEVIDEIERINNLLNAKCQMPNAIITTGFVTEEELPLIYAGALVYCMPSLSEGFGLPPLEAMACGTPVISSREACMPEILGEAALFFDAYEISDIAKSIETITSDTKLRELLTRKGLEQVKKYDWSKTAKETLFAYQSVLG